MTCDVLGQSRAGETRRLSLCRERVTVGTGGDRNRKQDSGVLGSTRTRIRPPRQLAPLARSRVRRTGSRAATSPRPPRSPSPTSQRRRRLAPSKACAVVAVRRRRRAVLKVEYPLPPRRPAASKQMQQARANGFSPRLSVRRPPFTLHPSPISGLRLRRLEVVHNNHDCDSEG